MKGYKKIFLLVSFLFSNMLLSSSSWALEMRSFEGKPTTLEQQVGKGKWSVVVFWSHSCGICRRETPALSRFHLEHKDIDAQVIGISIDGEKNKPLAKQFIKQTQMKFPSYIVELPLMAINFKQLTEESFRGTPTFLLYNPAGEIVGMQTGPVRVEALENFIASN